MRAHVVILAALLGAAAAAPQLVLSQKSHRGLEQALGGRVPVGVYSASRIYKGYEGNSNNVVVLNIPGLTHALGENFDAFDSHSSEENELVVLAGGVPLPGLVRRKRSFGGSDDDAEDEFALTPAEEGAFALSSLGTLMGANVGRWFDESYDANVKFFRGLEVTGNIVLSQLDDMLAEDKD